MSMVIGTNVASLSAQRQVGMAVRDQAEAMERNCPVVNVSIVRKMMRQD